MSSSPAVGPKRQRRLVALPGIVLLLASLVFCADFGDDEINCEEAVAHVIDCCPDLDVTDVNCSSYKGCETQYLPAIESGASECIQEASCKKIENAGVCLLSPMSDQQLRAARDQLGCGP